MQNKTARHWLPAIPRNIKLTELAAYVIILFEFMRTFFHGFYWQEGIRWRLASSPLMLYKSVGGECHVWLWNDFFVLHDNLLGIGRDRTRSQFRLQEVEVKPPSTSHMVGGFQSLLVFIRGEEAQPQASSLPVFIIPYWIEAVNELISFNAICKNQMAGTFWFVNAK